MSFCVKCGASLTEEVSFCPQCGESAVATATSGTAAAVQPARAEKTFLEQGDILVTNSRFIKGNQTFAMSGITSVTAFEEIPSKKGPIIVIVIGTLILLGSVSSSLGGAVVGLVVAGLGILWYMSIKNIYHVRLVSASGQKDAESDTNRARIVNIVNAINEAIIYRG